VALATNKEAGTDHPYLTNYFRTKDGDVELVNRLKAHPEIHRVCKLFDVYDMSSPSCVLRHSATRTKIQEIRNQLEVVLDDENLPYEFDSFLYHMDEDGIVDQVWGLLSEFRVWSSSLGFEII
jgi:hypothetical protein